MSAFIRALNFLLNIYMLIITIRIILTWFPGFGAGGLQEFLSRITDPYLNWFRRFSFLRIGVLDLSPIAALGVLSLVQRIIGTLAFYGTITLGIILAMILLTVWSAVSFFLGFLLIVLILRLIGHFLNRGMHSPFWRVVDTVSRPVLYRIDRVFFRGRIANFLVSLIVAIVSLGAVYFVLKAVVSILSGMLARMPV